MNSLNSLTKLFPNKISKIQSHILTRHVSVTKNYFSTPTKSINNSTPTKIPNGFFKITLRRSTIGLPLKLRKVVQALGLRRLQQTVYHSQTANIAGMILKVKEILQVRNVKRIPALEERKKRAEKGYIIIKKHNPGL
jgi:ribosomal protein L30